jgi:hypothetical protein
MKTSSVAALSVLAFASFFASIGTAADSAGATPVEPPKPTQSNSALSQQYATDLKHARRLADETHERNAKLLDRAEAAMTRQERNIDRYEKILSTWERQQAQYQKYLDSLDTK